ncbi:hypothetical protein [Paenibacillus alvei]|uniref:Uncharacterized protein n=1 Tax=Paenibacillus alvei TaxID=44250 RepID=A0A383RFQ0_PAEAL|nr:hypothetical protein [Paenibacillus alvei]SYX85927.1 conserved protein of unknown function [Paenibacillus alvei]SYX87678.1 conserved protein of unknown function [Paenibacillus alvei]
MGKSQRDKGARGEREFAELVGGRRVPLSGAAEGYANDVELPNGMKAEVKRRKAGFKQLYDWILDEREKPDIVALRTDRMPWIVSMKLETFLKLIGGKPDAEGQSVEGNEACGDKTTTP